MAGAGAVVSPMCLRALMSGVALMALLLHPSWQFTLPHSSWAQRAGGLPQHQDATSVQATLVASDSTPIHHSTLPHSSHPWAPSSSSSSSDSADPLSVPLAHHTTRPANWRKTNRAGENFRTSHRFGETPAQSVRQADALKRVARKKSDGSTSLVSLGESRQKAGGSSRRRQQQQNSPSYDDWRDQYPPLSPDAPRQPGDVRFSEVVQVEVGSAPSPSADRVQVKAVSGRPNSESDSAVVGALEESGHSQSLQQLVPQRTAGPHVSRMVLTAVGSLTAILGICVMAAIFQCCCRRSKRSTSSDQQGEEEEKKGLSGHKSGSSSGSRSTRSSKSPSPHKVLATEEEDTNRGRSEQEALLEEDKDLGDFSLVQRETSILRSYRKPPPPKNRARASRVPRALKAADPNASARLFQDNEQKDRSEAPQKAATNGLPSSESTSSDMQSSMLADIDCTLAALHNEPSPARSTQPSREPSAEKTPTSNPSSEDSQIKPPAKPAASNTSSEESQIKPPAKPPASNTSNDDSQIKSPAKPSLPTSPSREQLAKALSQELLRSASKEMLSKPHSKSATPTSSKETTPKSESAGASPKTAHSKNLSASSSKDSMGSSNGGASACSKSGSSPEEEDKNNSGNIFALIDPTAKDKATDAGGRSKIPVRAGVCSAQPTAPLRLSAGKDKRFPVPSVHGDQMDQLMKSLKTRLKEDDDESPKQASNADSTKKDSTPDEDLDPQRRDRCHSDPTQQQEERGTTLHQTHL